VAELIMCICVNETLASTSPWGANQVGQYSLVSWGTLDTQPTRPAQIGGGGGGQQDRQCVHDITLWRVRVTFIHCRLA
jgi:hypothetical protein